jgi:hypothetical protein
VPASLTAQRGHLPELRPRPAHREAITTGQVLCTRRTRQAVREGAGLLGAALDCPDRRGNLPGGRRGGRCPTLLGPGSGHFSRRAAAESGTQNAAPAGNAPPGPVAAQQAPAENLPFEETFRAGRIVWEPVKNVELTTKTAAGSKTQSTDFQVKFKYDVNGKQSIDTTGYKTYTWPDHEATFGPGAVIRLTQNSNVREGAIRAGEEWTWTGQQWTAEPPGSVAQPPSPKVDVPVAKKEPPSSVPSPKSTDKAPDSVRKLVDEVKDVSQFENKQLDAFSLLMRQGEIADVLESVQKDGAESHVVPELLKLINDKRASKNRGDQLMVNQAVFVLGELGPKAQEAVPTLKELQNHEEKLVSGQASLALEVMNGSKESWAQKKKRNKK